MFIRHIIKQRKTCWAAAKVTTSSYSQVKKSAAKPFDLTIPFIYPAIQAYPFLDKTFHAVQRGISSSLSLFHCIRHLYYVLGSCVHDMSPPPQHVNRGAVRGANPRLTTHLLSIVFCRRYTHNKQAPNVTPNVTNTLINGKSI